MPATLEMNSRKMQLKEMADSLLVSLNSASEASAESSENQSSSVPLPEAELVNAEAVSV